MKKTAIAGFSILFALLLIVNPTTLLPNTKSAKALNVSMQWGHLEPDYDENEKALEEDICDSIYWMFYYDYWGTWGGTNAWWTYTNNTVVASTMDWENNANNGVNVVTNWWVGDYHASSPATPPFYGHLWFYGHNTTAVNADVNDTTVYDHATLEGSITSKQYFNFIWTCVNGGFYWYDNQGNYYTASGIMVPITSPSPPVSPSPEPTNPNDEYGFFYSNDAVGMPLAWTGISNMNPDGYNSYSGSYCYIGFESQSPFMIDYLPGTQVQAVYFPTFVYEWILGYHDFYAQHQTVSTGLDFASINTFGCWFEDSKLYKGYWLPNYEDEMAGWWFCRMRVLGNANQYLPYY
jgi:hypothetical protein